MVAHQTAAWLVRLRSRPSWQTIRAFIDSTFRDLHAGRDQLVKAGFLVFPLVSPFPGVSVTELELGEDVKK